MPFLNLLTGNLSKKRLAWFLIPTSFVLLLFWFIARLLFGYNGQWYFWDRFPISSQGSLVKNPIGCWFFVAGTVVASFNIVILLTYVFRQLGRRFWLLSILFLGTGLIGAFGLFLVGVTPEGSGRLLGSIHSLGAQLAFRGLGSAAGLSVLIGLIRIIVKEPWPSLIHYLALLGLVTQVGSMMLFTKSPSVSQWTSFNVILIWLIGLFMIVPERCQDSNLS